MSSLVLARKYRPRNFSQLAGQDHVVRALTNAIAQRRLHHAYLFTGTRGIGKTTVSRILAKSLNCTGADGRGDITADPCGVCAACTEIDADRYVDYIEMDAASHRSIDEIRDLIERAAYKPSVGRFKVFMIDEAHQLTKDAFNALLKTLEEPPEYLKFVLATTDPERMLPTVLSRCLQFNLRPMAPETVQHHLVHVLDAEGLSHEAGALRLLSRAARGSMRDALSLTDQAIAYCGGGLHEAGVRAMLGTVGEGAVFDLLQALAQRDAGSVLSQAEAVRSAGLSPASLLEQMARVSQEAAVVQALAARSDAAASSGPAEGDDADALRVAALAREFQPDELQLLYSIVLHGRQELSLMTDDHAAFVMVLLRYLAFGGGDGQRPPRAAAAAAAPPTVSSSRSAPLRAPAPPVSAVRLPDPGPQTEPAAGLADRWDAAVRQVASTEALSGLVRELAWQSALVRIDPGPPDCWHLRVAHESLRRPALQDKLCAALAASLGADLRIELEAGDPKDTPAQRDAAERQRRQQAAEDEIRGDPYVRSLLTEFSGARIVPGSIKPVA